MFKSGCMLIDARTPRPRPNPKTIQTVQAAKTAQTSLQNVSKARAAPRLRVLTNVPSPIVDENPFIPLAGLELVNTAAWADEIERESNGSSSKSASRSCSPNGNEWRQQKKSKSK